MLLLGLSVYLVVAYSGQHLTQYMTRKLEIIACQQSARADLRDDGECKRLAIKPITIKQQQ